MAKPAWTRSLSFALDWGRGMPPKILTAWQPYIVFLDQLVRERGLELHHAFIHWHPDPDESHYCGVTYIDDKRMAFCQGNDKETMLHEIAHLEYKLQEHDEKWASKLIALHEKYLSGQELELANAELVKDYKSAERVMRRRNRKKAQARRKR